MLSRGRRRSRALPMAQARALYRLHVQLAERVRGGAARPAERVGETAVTPMELRRAREQLGMSAAALALALRLGKNGGRTVRRWEAGDSAIPGPAQVAVEAMLREQAARQS